MPLPHDGGERRSLLQAMSLNNRQVWVRAIVCALFILPVVAVFAGHLLYQVMEELQALKTDDTAAVAQVVHELRSVGFLFMGIIVLLCLLGIYSLFFVTVQVFGPQVALLRFIDQMKTGNYEPFRALRKNDQLKDIWLGLQELAATLKKRYPGG